MGNIILETKDLVFEYKGYEENKRALDNINIKVEEGEFLAILGHNGSGKSTLVKLFNGLLTPTSGDVIIKGMNTKDEDKLWDIREKAGMVFQNPDNQIVATIVEEDIAFGPENLGIEKEEIRRRIDEALNIVEMTEYRKHPPHLLSGGQKQRVAIAGILAMMPDILIFDEPTAMLDPVGRDEVLKTILRLNKEEKKTIILITHYMEEASYADRILVLNQGKLSMEGSPREIFSQVEEIKNLGLDVPQITELAYLLRKEGLKINKDILTINELVEEL